MRSRAMKNTSKPVTRHCSHGRVSPHSSVYAFAVSYVDDAPANVQMLSCIRHSAPPCKGKKEKKAEQVVFCVLYQLKWLERLVHHSICLPSRLSRVRAPSPAPFLSSSLSGGLAGRFTRSEQ